MRFMVLGMFVLLTAPGLARAHHGAHHEPSPAVVLQALDPPRRADLLDPPASNLRSVARASRRALLPCRTGFQLAAFRREGPLLDAGRFAQRCTTWAGVVTFN